MSLLSMHHYGTLLVMKKTFIAICSSFKCWPISSYKLKTNQLFISPPPISSKKSLGNGNPQTRNGKDKFSKIPNLAWMALLVTNAVFLQATNSHYSFLRRYLPLNQVWITTVYLSTVLSWKKKCCSLKTMGGATLAHNSNNLTSNFSFRKLRTLCMPLFHFTQYWKLMCSSAGM